MAIDINLNWHGNIHTKPTVTNSTTQNNAIPNTQASLTWELKPAQDGVRITGVTFYASHPDKTNKQNPISPSYLDLPGGHIGDNRATWKIDFKSNAGPRAQTQIWYDVQFADNDFGALDWDPLLTISPR